MCHHDTVLGLRRWPPPHSPPRTICIHRFLLPSQIVNQLGRPPTCSLARSLTHSLTQARLSFVVALNQPAEVEAAREGWKRGGRDQKESGGIRGHPRLHHSTRPCLSCLSSRTPRDRQTSLSSALDPSRGLLPQFYGFLFCVVFYQIRVVRIRSSTVLLTY